MSKNDNNIENDIIKRVIKGFKWYIQYSDRSLKNGDFRILNSNRQYIDDIEGREFYKFFEKYLKKNGNPLSGCFNDCEEYFSTTFEEVFIAYLDEFVKKFGLSSENKNDLYLINDLRNIMKSIFRRANEIAYEEYSKKDPSIVTASPTKETTEKIFERVKEDDEFKAFFEKRKEFVRKNDKKLSSTLEEETKEAAKKAKEVAKAKAKEEAEARAAERARARAAREAGRAARRRVQQPINNIVEVNENQQQAQEPVVPAVENQQPAQQQNNNQDPLEALIALQNDLNNEIEQREEAQEEEQVQEQNRHENQVAGQNNVQQQGGLLRRLNAAGRRVINGVKNRRQRQ